MIYLCLDFIKRVMYIPLNKRRFKRRDTNHVYILDKKAYAKRYKRSPVQILYLDSRELAWPNIDRIRTHLRLTLNSGVRGIRNHWAERCYSRQRSQQRSDERLNSKISSSEAGTN